MNELCAQLITKATLQTQPRSPTSVLPSPPLSSSVTPRSFRVSTSSSSSCLTSQQLKAASSSTSIRGKISSSSTTANGRTRSVKAERSSYSLDSHGKTTKTSSSSFDGFSNADGDEDDTNKGKESSSGVKRKKLKKSKTHRNLSRRPGKPPRPPAPPPRPSTAFLIESRKQEDQFREQRRAEIYALNAIFRELEERRFLRFDEFKKSQRLPPVSGNDEVTTSAIPAFDPCRGGNV